MTNDRIAALRQAHKDDLDGYREKQLHRLGEAMAIVNELKSSSKRKEAFYKIAETKLPKKLGADVRDKLTASFICYVTRAKSKTATEQVSNQARALDYLVDDQGVQPENIAAEIMARGGIEKIVKMAAKVKPRRLKLARGRKDTSKPLQKKQAKMQSKLPLSDLEVEDDWGTDSADELAQEGDLTTVTLQIASKQLVKFMTTKAGRRMKLLCIRLDRGDSDVAAAKIQEVRRLKR